MSQVSASLVKELREKTGAGMLDCKQVLAEAQGDLEKALELLRKKGMASAAKKSTRLASEGLIYLHQDASKATLVEVNCETDFVGKNEEFQDFVRQVAETAHQQKPSDLEAFLKTPLLSSSKSVDERSKELIAKIGENISVRRFQILEAQAGQLLGAYTHMGSKIGAMVLLQGHAAQLSEEIRKGVAMHVAAVAPRFLKVDEIPAELLAKEKEIFLSQMQDSGKPKEILEKIIEGKLKKFASEICLDEQIYIRDPEAKLTVAQYLKSLDPQAKVLAYARFQVGEGMEKKNEDFAAEVAKQLK